MFKRRWYVNQVTGKQEYGTYDSRCKYFGFGDRLSAIYPPCYGHGWQCLDQYFETAIEARAFVEGMYGPAEMPEYVW
jgi:hypothetical protein